MLGLMYLGAALLYLTLLFFVVRWAWRKGRANGKSLRRGALFAALGLLAFILPPLFSALPTEVAHRKSCELDAGYQVLVSLTQWTARHPDIEDRLKNVDSTASTKVPGAINGFSRRIDFGGSSAWDQQISQATAWGVEITRTETRIVDLADDSILAKSIDYATGSKDDAFVWRTRASCFSQLESPMVKLIKYSHDMKGLKK
jgi:hypothetical protein